MYISPIWGAETLGELSPNFFLVVGVHDIITPFKFGDDRFRGFRSAEGQSLPFPVYFEGRPYNIHTIVWDVMLTHLEQKRLQIDTDLVLIITRTAVELSEGTNIADLKQPWSSKIENFSKLF